MRFASSHSLLLSALLISSSMGCKACDANATPDEAAACSDGSVRIDGGTCVLRGTACDGGVYDGRGACVHPGAVCDGGVYGADGSCRSGNYYCDGGAYDVDSGACGARAGSPCDGGVYESRGACVAIGSSCDGGVWATDAGLPFCAQGGTQDAGSDADVDVDAGPDAAVDMDAGSDAAVDMDAGLDAGGDAGPAPIITAVAPSGTLGAQGAEVTFSLAASGDPTAWSWSFGGGTTLDVNAVEAPQVTLGAPGTYTGSVTATNARGTSAPYSFTYTVSAAAGAPSIVSLYLPGSAHPGETGQFSAIANDSPTSFAWSFGGGATPNTSTEAFPSVTFGAAGTYTVTLVATNASGSSEPYSSSYTVSAVQSNSPVLGQLSQTGYLGATGETINFNVSGSDVASATWSWDFGTGATLYGPSEQYTSITLAAPGLHTGSVTATTGAGADTLSFSFAVTSTPIYAPTFQTFSVASSTLSAVAPRAILLADARPLVAYVAASNHIAVSVSDAVAPLGSSSFTVHEADVAVSQPPRALAAALLGNVPALAYLYPDAGDLVLAVSIGTQAPAQTADWTRHEVTHIAGAGGSTAADVEMSVVSGGLVIAVLSDTGLSMAFAQIAVPTSSASWAVHVLDASTTLRDCALADHNGTVVGYIDAGGTQRFATATFDPPTQASEWSTHEVETYAGANHLSMTVMGQFVVMSATGDTIFGTGHVLRALASAPTTATDWQSSEMGPEFGPSAITTLDGRIALASMTSTTSAVAYAFRTLLPDVITADTWQYRQLDAPATNPLMGSAFGLSDGRFAFCYSNAASSGSVVFAQANALW